MQAADVRSETVDGGGGEAGARAAAAAGVSGARIALTVLLLAVVAAVVLRSAWLSEDAFITFRVLDNFANGYGLRWNVAERVQPYTHPLWLLALLALHALSGELFLTALALGLATTLLAAALVALRVARASGGMLLALAVMVGSKAYVDYSTSGLENPLTHLLLAGALAAHYAGPGRAPALALCAGLAVLNRMDAVLLVAPLLACMALEQPALRSAKVLLAGFAPFLLWELFALTYYGFPFPNSAYAKLRTGLERTVLVEQGLYYLWSSLRIDPLTPAAIVAGLLVLLHTRSRRDVFPVLGMLAYLVYVVGIGGDFMSGRFLTAPLLLGCGLLARLELRPAAALPACAVALALSLAAPLSPLRAGRDYEGDPFRQMDARQIADERAYYYKYTGLLRVGREGGWPNHPWMWDGVRGRESGFRVLPVSHVGFYGYAAGPSLHVVDLLGLSDPLLARLSPRTDRPWRIGHFERALPKGYLETVADPAGRNHIEDPQVAALYESLRLVTRADLFAAGRWAAIWRLNLASP